jgi:hypothetical protein
MDKGTIVLVVLLALAIVVLAFWVFSLSDRIKRLCDTLDFFRDRISALERNLVAIEGRTAFHAPQARGVASASFSHGTSSGGVQHGYTLNNEYVGMDKTVNMLMKKLKVGLRRPASEICLVEIVETPAGISGKGGPDGKNIATTSAE